MIVNKRVRNGSTWVQSQNNRRISVCFQGRSFNIPVTQVHVLNTDAEEDEVDNFYKDLQDLLEITPKKKKGVLFIIGDWNAKAGSQEIPRQIWP